MFRNAVLISYMVTAFVLELNAQVAKPFTITGTIKGVQSGVVQLLALDSDKIVDSAIISNGQFVLKGNVALPERRRFYISVPGLIVSFQAFVEAPSTTLLIDTVGAEYHQDSKEKWAMLWRIEQQGSNMADIWSEYEESIGMHRLVPIFRNMSQKEKDAAISVLTNSRRDWIKKFVKDHPSSIPGLYIAFDFFESTSEPYSFLQSVLDLFSADVKSSIYFKELNKMATSKKNMQTGKPAPDFTLPDRTKKNFALSSMQGKYVLIDFWASWCVPCRKAIPKWKEVYKKYSKKGLEIVGVANDRHWDDWIAALEKEEMPWYNLIDSFPSSGRAAVGEKYDVPSLPFYVLIDRAGKILLTSIDYTVVEQAIEQVFVNNN